MEVNKWLSKTYKGRFIEHLEQFLIGLDANYQWQNYHFNYKPNKSKEKFFFSFYCISTDSLLLVTVHKVQPNAENFISVRYNEMIVFALNDKTFIVDAVYTKAVAIQDTSFDSIYTHFEFLFPQKEV
jgi:hypothetical protein